MRIIDTCGLVGLAWFLLVCRVGSAATNYVALFGGHIWPYTNWVSAATNIQDAVAAAADGDWVLVSSGEYRSGGAVAPGNMLMNRVCVTNRITLASVFGRDATVIVGAPDPLTGDLGSNAVRCVYMTNNAVLCGFTLSNGHTLATSLGGVAEDCNGGGIFLRGSVMLKDSTMILNHAGVCAGGLYASGPALALESHKSKACPCGTNGTALRGTVHHTARGEVMQVMCVVTNCIVRSNAARSSGAGAMLTGFATILSSRLEGNAAQTQDGGGVFLNGSGTSACYCDIVGNSAAQHAGGVWISAGVISNCTVTGNGAGAGVQKGGLGGGVFLIDGGRVYSCTITGNIVHGPASGGNYGQGGGVYCNGGVIYNSRITGNGATGIWGGGGIFFGGGLLYSSTVANNWAFGFGGGTVGGTIKNCIVYGNTAGQRDNCDGGSFEFSCTTPLPGGVGNISNAPVFMADYELAPGSPCIDSGTNGYVSWDTDLAGKPRIINGIVDMGAYEALPEPTLNMLSWLVVCFCVKMRWSRPTRRMATTRRWTPTASARATGLPRRPATPPAMSGARAIPCRVNCLFLRSVLPAQMTGL